MKRYNDIDEYIAAAPQQVHNLLRSMRKTIHKAAPKAVEKISYGIPTFTLHGNLVHFAGYESHVGFYPGAAPLVAFKDKLTAYETSKGTIRFPVDKPLPLDLIHDMVVFCVKRNSQKKG